MGRRRMGVGLLAAGSMLALLFAFPLPALASSPLAATFNPNLLLRGSSTAAEPSIRTNSKGQSFVIGPVGVPAGCKAFRITHDGSSSKFLGEPDHQLGGGDCDWAIGPKETGVSGASSDLLAYSSLTLPNITVGKSDDGGKTFGPPNPAAAQVGGDDRMWNEADPKLNDAGLATVYMNYHDVSLLEIEVSVSIDGGQTYTQSAPEINPDDVPTGQWEGLGAFSGNELGNLVAFRPRLKGGLGRLTLYSIFETPDSAADNIFQGAAGTFNYNRVYEAVGTVDDSTPVPTVTWHDYEIWHGPKGKRFNRIFPVTTVDRTGRVYAFWSDGNAIYAKSDRNGTGWDASVAPKKIPNPSGVNTAIMPWAQAGKSGIVDAVFYGATGGKGKQPNPQDDPANRWNVYMAQTVDAGRSWKVFKASDHRIHTGPICIDGLNCETSNPPRNRTLLDFFQVSVDPTDGAADIAYADDHASPGSAVIYFTRQCSGTSAISGTALVNDCRKPAAPPAPPAQSTCPGPQVADFTGDAPNNYPAGDGRNMDNLDIVNASFGTPDATNLQVTLRLKDLEAPPPPANLISGFWTVYWTYKGTVYFAQATSNGSGSAAVFSFSDGTFSDGNFNPVGTPDGSAETGPNGTFTMTVPRADVGNPPNGATLTSPFADVHGSFTVLGAGVYYTAAADRAPDSNFGASYVVGQTCVPSVPVPPVLAPAGGGPFALGSLLAPAAAGGFVLVVAGTLAIGLRRRQSRRLN